MKKKRVSFFLYSGLIVVFLLFSAADALIFVKSKPSGAAGWSDDFNTNCSGVDADSRTGWGTTYEAVAGTQRSTYFDCTGNELVSDERTGFTLYLLADYSDFADANYCVTVKLKQNSDGEQYMAGPVVRGAVAGSNTLTGYYLWVDSANNDLGIMKCVAGTCALILADDGMTNYDWASYQTVKLCVTGSTSTTITAHVGITEEASVTDTAACEGAEASNCAALTAAGLAGLACWDGVDPQDQFFDDFAIDETDP